MPSASNCAIGGVRGVIASASIYDFVCEENDTRMLNSDVDRVRGVTMPCMFLRTQLIMHAQAYTRNFSFGMFVPRGRAEF